MAPIDEPHLSPAQEAELSALADGSLTPTRRDGVERWIAGSAELRNLYERERAVVELLHKQAALERAPMQLRERIEAQRAPRRPAARRRTGYGLLAGALAAVALVLSLVLPAGTPGAPSVSQAGQLALRGASFPAPAPDPASPRARLEVGLQEVYFPNWSTTLGWRATGLRRDRLDGRPAMTVYYQSGSKSAAYTIVGAPALAQPSAPVRRLNGVELRVLRLGGRNVVTWQRAGHTCVLSAAGVSGQALEQLAAWPVGLRD